MDIPEEQQSMIRLSKSVVGKEEISAVKDVLERGYLGMGDEVAAFESELSEFFGRPAVCVNTGTAAIHLACQAAGLKPGDEILIQSLTYVASYQAISASGAVPVPCEVNLDTFTLDLNDAEKKISERTKAVMPVHYSGGCGDLESYYEFASEYNLRIIEDAAHAFGTLYQNKKIGGFGDIVCFSFDGIKNITSGEGGAVTSSDESVLNKIRDARLLGVINDTEKRFSGKRSWDFDVAEQGWRYHMSNIMAAIGRTQLKKFDSFASKRQSLAKLYVSQLRNIKGLATLKINYDESVPHIFVIIVEEAIRDELAVHLNNLGIQTGLHYKPNHLLSYYNSKNYKLEKTETIAKKIITLPLHPELEFDDVKFISDEIRKVAENKI